MKRLSLFLCIILIPALVLGQSKFNGAEMSGSWQDTHEIWTPEEGIVLPAYIPSAMNISAARYMSRLRLQDQRGFPFWEFQQTYTQGQCGPDSANSRMGGYIPTPLHGLKFKGTLTEYNRDDYQPRREFGSYAQYHLNAFDAEAGLDYQHLPWKRLPDNTISEGQVINKVWSVKGKYHWGMLTPMLGVSSEPDVMERYNGGLLVDLPMQFEMGASYSLWDDKSGWATVIGRYNKRDEFGGLPSFALIYIDVPNTYKWMNFRVTWGDRGGHYVRPTFDEPTFGGMMDVCNTLLVKPLVSENYRFFDSPLIFFRYDEYGTLALRVNDIFLASNVRKTDANLSFNTGLSVGPVKSLRTVLSYGRLHHPVYGWQDDRSSVNLIGYAFGKLMVSAAYMTDFDQYEDLMVELRLAATFDKY